MKRLHKDQRGLTIIELLVVIILTGLITAAITTTFFQVFDMNTRTANHMSALSQVQHAGKIVSQDILQTQTVLTGDTEGFPLSLNWTEGGITGDSHEVIYTLKDGELWRSETIGGDSTTTRVAEYINPTETNCCCDCDRDGYCDGSCGCDGGVVIFTVTATVGEESEQRIYRVQPRPGS